MASARGQRPASIDFLGLPYCSTTGFDDTGVPIRVFAIQAPTKSRDCPTCGLPAASNGSCIQNYWDVPRGGKPVVVCLQTQRALCKNPDCPTKTFQLHHGEEFRGNATRRCKQYIENNCFLKTFAAVSAETGVPEATVRHIADRLLKKLDRNFRIDTPTVLAIDEVYLRSGKDPAVRLAQRENFPEQKTLICRTVISNSETSQVVDVLEDTKLATVVNFLTNLQGSVRVKYVTMDMWFVFRDAVRAAFGTRVKVVADRWHVQKAVNAVVDKARLSLRGRERRLADKFQKALLTRGARLRERNPVRYLAFENFLQNVPLMAAVYEAKERLLGMYNAPSRQSAESHYQAWKEDLRRGIAAKFFSRLVSTMEIWRTEIFAYWDTGYAVTRLDPARQALVGANYASPHPLAPLAKRLTRSRGWKGATNGSAEARNNVIRQLNRTGRSYSFRFLRARAIFSTYVVSELFGVCDGCRLPFKRDPNSPRRASELRSHAFVGGRNARIGSGIVPACRDCDARSTGTTRPGAKPLPPSATHCGLADVWTISEPSIADDPIARQKVERRYRALKASYVKRFGKSDPDPLQHNLFAVKP